MAKNVTHLLSILNVAFLKHHAYYHSFPKYCEFYYRSLASLVMVLNIPRKERIRIRLTKEYCTTVTKVNESSLISIVNSLGRLFYRGEGTVEKAQTLVSVTQATLIGRIANRWLPSGCSGCTETYGRRQTFKHVAAQK